MNAIDSLGWTLVHTLWQGVVVAGLLVLMHRAMHRSSANARYVASCAAMGMLIVMPVVTFVLLRAPQTFPIAASDQTPLAVSQPTPRLTAVEHDPVVLSERRNVMRQLVLVWSIGVVSMGLWHLCGWLWLFALRNGKPAAGLLPALDRLRDRLRVARVVRLIESARIDVPAVVGVFTPVILVPIGILNDLTARQVEAILAHELAHVRRHDYLVNLIQAAVETLMFYHPAAWWISAQVRRERENCCDDLAAAVCGDRTVYADALTALEERRAPHPALAATGGNLLDRVRRLLNLPAARRRTSIRSLAAAIVALACVVFPLALSRAQQPPAPTTAPAVVVAAPGEFRFVKVIVGRESLVVHDKRIEWSALKKLLDDIPQDQRSKTVLEVAAAAPDVTVERFFNVSARLADLVKQYNLAYLSQTGIQPTTEPTEYRLPEGTEMGEYYMDGLVVRPGVYSLTARKITLKQAIAAAGNVERGILEPRVTVIRRVGQDKEEIFLDAAPLVDILNLKREDIILRANDIVRISGRTDPGLQQLLDERYEMELRVARLRRQYGTNHPSVAAAQEDLDAANRKIEAREGSATTKP